MSQSSQPPNMNTTPKLPGDPLDFLNAAFRFFGDVLKVLQNRPLLATLWGFAVLFFVFITMTLVRAADIPSIAKAGIVMSTVIILAVLFVFTASRIDPRRAYPKLNDLKEIANLHRQLEDLIYLERYLQDVQTSFEPCAQAVECAHNSWHNLQVNELTHNWQSVQQDRMAVLRAFVQSHPALDVQAWFPQVEKYSVCIDDSLVRGALEPLITNILTYKKSVLQAEAQVWQQLSQDLTELTTLSNQVLGHLPQKKRLASKSHI